MDRQAEIIYLKNIRDLEMAKKFVKEKIAHAENTASHAYDGSQPILKNEQDIIGPLMINIARAFLLCCLLHFHWYAVEIDYKSLLFLLLFLIDLGAIALTFNILHDASYSKDNDFLIFCTISIVLHGIIAPIQMIFITHANAGIPTVIYQLWAVLIFLSAIIPTAIDIVSQNKNISLENAQEQRRVARVQMAAPEIYNKARAEAYYYKRELQKIEYLLKKGYSLNIIPDQYRYLAAVQYMYNWMSTCQDTLRDTLLHTHLEDGIRRIEAKLDTIIYQNMELIAHSRKIEASLRRSEVNDLKRLDTLRQIETNSANAAMYAQIGSQYAEASAFFGAANYFRISGR